MNNKIKAGLITSGILLIVGGLTLMVNKYPEYLMNITLTAIGGGVLIWLYKLILAILESE
jgi:hypothetical protein